MLKLRFLILILFISPECMSQINIWENTDCDEYVTLTPYLSPGTNNLAIIILPGGSYFWHAKKTEGKEVALWLQKNGISAFVLNYRTAKVPAFIFRYRYFFRGNRYPDPQNDLRQALKLIRKNAEQYGIDVNQVGVLGFSAGGHLAMSSVELFPKAEWPDFIAAIYPVVTMNAPYVHKRSRRALLGDDEKNNPYLRDSLSLELHVPADCPPAFLMNCKDDPIVDYHNSILLDSALSAQKIPHLYLQYQTGGHGFGVSPTKGSAESRKWKEEFLNWIAKLTSSKTIKE